MVVWRICKRKWAASAFSGQGAAENPGRWNSEGRKAVYCGESRALAAWEVLAHAASKRALRHAEFVAIPADVPDDRILRPNRFPADWNALPAPESTRRLGDRFLAAAEFPVLQVPSVTVRGEFCFVLNPLHADFPRIVVGKPEPFSFDGRTLP